MNKKTHGQQPKSPKQIKIWVFSYYEEIKDVRAPEGGSSIEELSHEDQVEVEVQNLTLFVDASISTPTQMVGLGAAVITANNKVQAALSKPLKGTKDLCPTRAKESGASKVA
ncbi:hypothetical protein AgCh_039234 [Apium graveolens]